MFLDKGADLTHHQGGEARVDVLGQAGLQRGETLLLKPRGDGPCPGLLGPLEQCRPAPECQRFAEPAYPDQVLEPERVDRASRDVESVTSRDRRDPLFPELPAQVAHVAVDQVGS